MEALLNSITHLPEILSAVVMVLGGQKGFEIYKRKRYSNGGRDRRSSQSHNSFCQGDKDFIEGCFKDQTKEMVLTKKIDRLDLVVELGDIIRSEGKDTREVIRSLK